MTPVTMEEYFEMFKKKSLILNPERAKSKSNRPAASRCFFGVHDLKCYLEEILNQDTDMGGNPVGLIQSAKLSLQNSRDRWDSYNNAQRKKLDKPIEQFAQDINMFLAKIKILEAESRAIIKVVEAAEQREKEEVSKRKKIGAFHRRLDGTIKDCDGREVDAEGLKFTDNGEKVSDYLEEIKAERMAKNKQLRQQAKVRKELVDSGAIPIQL